MLPVLLWLSKGLDFLGSENIVFHSETHGADCFLNVHSYCPRLGQSYEGFLFLSHFTQVQSEEGKVETRYACILKINEGDEFSSRGASFFERMRASLGYTVEKKIEPADLYRCVVPEGSPVSDDLSHVISHAITYLSKAGEKLPLCLHKSTNGEESTADKGSDPLTNYIQPISMLNYLDTKVLRSMYGLFTSSERCPKDLLVTYALVVELSLALNRTKHVSCLTHRRALLGNHVLEPLCERSTLTHVPSSPTCASRSDPNVLMKQVSYQRIFPIALSKDGIRHTIQPYDVVTNMYESNSHLEKFSFPDHPEAEKLIHRTLGPIGRQKRVYSEGWCIPNTMLPPFQNTTDTESPLDAKHRALLYASLGVRCPCSINTDLLARYVDPEVMHIFHRAPRTRTIDRMIELTQSLLYSLRSDRMHILLAHAKNIIPSLALLYFFNSHPLLFLIIVICSASYVVAHIRQNFSYAL